MPQIIESVDHMINIEDLLEEVAAPLSDSHKHEFEEEFGLVPEHIEVWEIHEWRLDRYIEERFDDFLDECEGSTMLAGFGYSTSTLLKDADEVAYNQAKDEYIDGQLPLTIDDCFWWCWHEEVIPPIDMNKVRRLVEELLQDDNSIEAAIVRNAAYNAVRDAGERRTGKVRNYKYLLFHNTLTDEYFSTLQDAVEAVDVVQDYSSSDDEGEE